MLLSLEEAGEHQPLPAAPHTAHQCQKLCFFLVSQSHIPVENKHKYYSSVVSPPLFPMVLWGISNAHSAKAGPYTQDTHPVCVRKAAYPQSKQTGFIWLCEETERSILSM